MWFMSAKLVWIPFYILLTYLLFRKVGIKNGILALVFIGLTIAMADQVCSHLIRPAFERLRPSNPSNPISQYIHIVNGYRGGLFGFPSCHAANTFALATFLSMTIKRRAFIIGIFIWAVLVSYSRMYLGVHYPMDILVGGSIGTCLAIFCYAGYSLTLRNAAAIKAGSQSIMRRFNLMR